MKTLTMIAALVGAVVLAPMAAVAHTESPAPAPVDFRALAFEGGQSSNATSSCYRERMRGEEAGAHHGTTGAFFLSMFFLPYLFIPPPSPPEAMMTGMTAVDAACFADGYKPVAKSKLRRHALTGMAAGAVSALTLIAVTDGFWSSRRLD